MPPAARTIHCRTLVPDEAWVDFRGHRHRVPDRSIGRGVIVAERGGSMLGWCSWVWYPDLISFDDEVTDQPLRGPYMLDPDEVAAEGLVYIASLYVPPRHRGQGVLRFLLAELQRLWLPTYGVFIDPALGRFIGRTHPPARLTGQHRISFDLVGESPVEESAPRYRSGSGWDALARSVQPLNRDATRHRVVCDLDIALPAAALEDAAEFGRILHGDPRWRPATLAELLLPLAIGVAAHDHERRIGIRRIRLSFPPS